MPVRYTPIRAAAAAALRHQPRPRLRAVVVGGGGSVSTRAPFHDSGPLRDDIDDRNHYETLNVHPDASPAEIKKSFYSLSKTHHPDHNRHDPHASRRFMRISEAYSVLSHHDKRAKYDRDVLRRHTEQHHHGHHPHRGSYHSTGPVGGRAPSGLSKRRGTFQGPPPSFFRSGGWGAHSAKRKAAHEESTGGAESAGSQHGGMGPGQDPFGHRDDVPHFDKHSHERTGQRIDQRRAQRMAGEGVKFSPEAGMTGSFFAILGVLGLAIGFPFLIIGGWRSKESQDKKKKGKRAST